MYFLLYTILFLFIIIFFNKINIHVFIYFINYSFRL